jgi:hypothetical protein
VSNDWDDPTDGRRAYRVEVAGVGGPRSRHGRAAAVALAVVAVLVVGGIVSSQLFPSAQARVAPSASLAALGSASPTAPAAPTVVPVPTGPLTARVAAVPVDVVALIAAIPRHGTGPLAFVGGRLHSTSRPCEPGAPLSACLTLHIDGLRAARVVPDDAMGSWPGDPAPGETLVLLPRDGRLVFLGSVVVDPAGIPRIDVLSARLAADPLRYGRPLPSLHEADGNLVSGASTCAADGPCLAGAPALLAAPPSGALPTADTGAAVVLIEPGAFGVDAYAGQSTGPFLMRRRANPNDGAASWQVVAREDQGSILHVVIP